MLRVGSLSSFRKFVSSNEHLGLYVDGSEKEVASLLRKLEAIKGRTRGASGSKRRPFSTSRFDRDLRS